jgi:nucleoside-diphosphate-sugar epimerase
MERQILITGATGYVGGRLLDALEAKSLQVRCMARVFPPVHQRLQRQQRTRSGFQFIKRHLKHQETGVAPR